MGFKTSYFPSDRGTVRMDVTPHELPKQVVCCARETDSFALSLSVGLGLVTRKKRPAPAFLGPNFHPKIIPIEKLYSMNDLKYHRN